MRTELEQLLSVVDRVSAELHPELPQEFMRQVILVEEKTGMDAEAAIEQIRTLVADFTTTSDEST